VQSGSGLLVVTGDFNANGGFSWNGTILVLGTGSFNLNGGGGGQINGGLFIAKTADMKSDGTGLNLLSSLGTPNFNWNGGGNASMTWDSCWANVLNGQHSQYYSIISFRELMY
jgi:hypothetical protein